MEFVEGDSLRQWQRDKDRSWRTITSVYCQAARGLIAAHAAGIVHRDFKPSNVLVGNDGRARVADFGLARSTDRSEPSSLEFPSTGDSPLSASLTRSGAVLGTPAYMAPEQLRGGEVDAAADQWSFCVALWEALYGTRPFNPQALRPGSTPPRPKTGRPRGPRALRAALTRGLDLDPAGRWPDMSALEARLQALAAPGRYSSLMVVAGGVAIVGVAYAAARDEPCPPDLDKADRAWSTDARASLHESLISFAPEIAESAAEDVIRRLDRFRSEWLDAQVASCEISLRPDPQSPGRAESANLCLDLSLVRLRTAVEALEGSELQAFARADALLETLGAPQDCLQPDQARTQAEDQEHLAMLEAARVGLALGHPPSKRVIDAVAPESSLWDSPSPRLEVTALDVRGRLRVAEGRAQDGAADLLAAVGRAEASRQDRTAAMLWLELVDVATIHLLSNEDADAWLARADSAVGRLGRPVNLELRFQRAAGLVARENGRWEEAGSHVRRALEGSQLSTTLWGKLELELADVEIKTGETEAGVARMHRVLDRFVERLGSSHPYVADAQIYLGRQAKEDNDLGAAETHFSEAYRIRAQAFGVQSPRTSTPLMGLAAVRAAQGHLDAALKDSLRVVELQRALPPNHVERGGGLSVVGAIAQAQSDHEQAASAYAELAEEWKTGPRAPERPKALVNAAWNNLTIGRAAQARPLYAALRAETEPGSEFHLIALAGLGRVDHLIGENEVALVELEAALGLAEVRDPDPDANKELLPEIQWHLADVLNTLERQPARRCALVASALSRYRSWPERAKARASLAELQQRCATEGNER